MGTMRKDLTGTRFGRLTAVNWVSIQGGNASWMCRCDCGGFKVVTSAKLGRGEVQSCGCIRREIRGAAHPLYKHGHSCKVTTTRTYRIWSNMKTRCTNPHDKKWSDYGGRGIAVCERWLKFENFLADMGECPPNLTLDRHPDTNGNYEPDNCRWATQREQQQNRRDNVWLTINGERMVMSEAARRHGVLASSLRLKIKAGFAPEAAIAFLQALRT